MRRPDFSQTFGRVVVVNLASRRDRLDRFSTAFQSWPFGTPERFEAVDGSVVAIPKTWNKGPGAWGCMLSHRAILSAAIRDGVSSLFVLEDDAFPVPDFARLAGEFMARVPSDWDCLMFGAEHLLPALAMSPGVVRCCAANRTHAYAVRGRMMPVLLDSWERTVNEHCDIVLAALMRHFFVYAPDPFLIGQAGGYSDVTRTDEPVRFLTARQLQAHSS
jgi:hypothetical protein